MPNGNQKGDEGCRFIEIMEVVGGKWRGTIIYCLSKGARRFSELKRDIPSISQKMLTQELRALERDGLVNRTQYPEIPPRVEYALTDLGRTMTPIFAVVDEWRPKLKDVERARVDYDRRSS